MRRLCAETAAERTTGMFKRFELCIEHGIVAPILDPFAGVSGGRAIAAKGAPDFDQCETKRHVSKIHGARASEGDSTRPARGGMQFGKRDGKSGGDRYCYQLAQLLSGFGVVIVGAEPKRLAFEIGACHDGLI
jgi:hypothetical protein